MVELRMIVFVFLVWFAWEVFLWNFGGGMGVLYFIVNIVLEFFMVFLKRKFIKNVEELNEVNYLGVLFVGVVVFVIINFCWICLFFVLFVWLYILSGCFFFFGVFFWKFIKRGIRWVGIVWILEVRRFLVIKSEVYLFRYLKFFFKCYRVNLGRCRCLLGF